MKKNVMMRVASALMVAVLLSTCAISGTFAKYVTSGSAMDTARVAEFGVVISAGGQLFGDTYKAVGEGNSIVAWSNANAGTVNSGTENEDVVAPGTKNETGLTFGVTGAPEVKVHVDFTVSGSDIVLKTGTYDKTTTSTNTTDTFALASNYYPVVFTLHHSIDGGSTYTEVATAGNTLATIAAYLSGLDADYAPNTNLVTAVGSYKITWEWVFDGNDDADTFLGDLAVNNALTAAANYQLTTEFSVTISVTQVD